MFNLLTEVGSHRRRLGELLAKSANVVRIASAYVTEQDLLRAKAQKVRLLTSVLPMDVISGATSLEALSVLLKTGAQIKRLPDSPRLHAKVYIFDDKHAVVTSANLTRNALDSNIEVGIEVSGNAVNALVEWFDTQWNRAERISATQLADWELRIAGLRKSFSDIRDQCPKFDKTQTTPSTGHEPSSSGAPSDAMIGLRDWLTNKNSKEANRLQFFVCNTNRRNNYWTPDGRHYLYEHTMKTSRYAAVWETFKYPTHMKKVKRGDVIFMFAKKVGVIGVGCASGGCEILEHDNRDRVLVTDRNQDSREWRIKIEDWQRWVNDSNAFPYPYQPPNASFWEITEDEEFCENLRIHFG